MNSYLQSLDSENQSVNWTQSLNSTADFNNSSIHLMTSNEPNSVESFCNTLHPTAKQFDALQENNKIQAFRDFLKVCIYQNRK